MPLPWVKAKWETPPPPSKQGYIQSQRTAVRYFHPLGRWCGWETFGMTVRTAAFSFSWRIHSAPSQRTRGRAIRFSDAGFPVILWPWCELPWQFPHIRSALFGAFYVLKGNKACAILHCNSIHSYGLSRSEVSGPMTLTCLLPVNSRTPLLLMAKGSYMSGALGMASGVWVYLELGEKERTVRHKKNRISWLKVNHKILDLEAIRKTN